MKYQETEQIVRCLLSLIWDTKHDSPNAMAGLNVGATIKRRGQLLLVCYAQF